jgi:hypothetical protein
MTLSRPHDPYSPHLQTGPDPKPPPKRRAPPKRRVTSSEADRAAATLLRNWQ